MNRVLAAIPFAFGLLCCSPEAPPSDDCESGDDCEMIVVGSKCGEAAVCGCGVERVPGNVRDAEEFQRRFESEICVEPICFVQTLCLLTDEVLFCSEGRCGVAEFGAEPPPGASIRGETETGQ